MRIFIAIFPPPEVQRTLLHSAQEAAIEGNIRWVRRKNVHLTLKFLGNVSSEDLASIDNALTEVAWRHKPHPIEPFGLGAFPSAGKARVLWAGIDKGSTSICTLADDIDNTLEPLGFGRERRSYKPHMTLGRSRGRPIRLPDGFDLQAPEFTPSRMYLVESVTGAEGATYERIESYPLSRASREKGFR